MASGPLASWTLAPKLQPTADNLGTVPPAIDQKTPQLRFLVVFFFLQAAQEPASCEPQAWKVTHQTRLAQAPRLRDSRLEASAAAEGAGRHLPPLRAPAGRVRVPGAARRIRSWAKKEGAGKLRHAAD